MKYSITAVIPVVQYGNIQPCIEVEADTFEEAHAQAMPHIQKVWDAYGEKPLKNKYGDRKLLKAFVGGEVYYDSLTHSYTNEAGEVYLSGSQYAKLFEKPFDKDGISKRLALRDGLDQQALLDQWELNAEVSRGFGTALHAALELFGKYGKVHDHPVLKKAVQGFYEARKDEKAEYEVLIVDHQAKHAGQIDRLLITGDKQCRVQDFKTNADIEKSLSTYWKQLEFYADIMKANGWKVDGLDIFHWNGEWKEYSK